MMIKLILKLLNPIWYDLTDHGSYPRTITLLEVLTGIAWTVSTFIAVVAWGDFTGYLFAFASVTIASLTLILVITKLFVHLWRNIPWWIEVWRSEREEKKVEIIEYVPTRHWWQFFPERLERIKIFLGYHRLFDPRRRLPRKKKKGPEKRLLLSRRTIVAITIGIVILAAVILAGKYALLATICLSPIILATVVVKLLMRQKSSSTSV